MSKFTDASLVVVPSLHKAGKLYAVKPGTGLADFTVTRSTVKWVLGPNGVLRSVPANTPALEYNTDRTFRGMLVEPAATNSIRNNTMVGAVAGTPGTLPTNWFEGLAGLTREVVGTGTENGIDYIDIRLHGTATASPAAISTETATSIVASNGQTWTASAYLKVISSTGSTPTYRLDIIERDSGGSVLATRTKTISPTGTLTRFDHTFTLAGGASVARVTSPVVFSLSVSSSYDFTIRIGLPQMEQSAVATSVMKTSGSTFNRTADSIVRTSASDLIGQTSGTMYVEVEVPNFTTSIGRRVLQLSDGTTSNRISLNTLSGGNRVYQLFVVNGGVNTVDIQQISGAVNISKVAIGYATNDYVLYVNGNSIGTDTLSNVPATSRIDIGNLLSGNDNMIGWIRSVVISSERFPNAELATLTTL